MRSVAVTGASSGIGRATALLLARSEFQVFAGVRKVDDAEALRREGGERISPVLLDVTDQASIAVAAERIDHALGGRGLDGLVNNAGIGLAAPLEYVPLEDVRHVFEVNLFGQLAVTQALLPAIRRARGRVVNIGSIGTNLAIPFGGVLNASKAAFASFDDSMRLELAPFGVGVILIEPASIATPAVEKTLGSPEAKLRALPHEAAERYGERLMKFMRRGHDFEKRGSPPDVVARVVLRALTARRPKVRYRAGRGAWSLSVLPRLFPKRALDRLELRLLGLA